MSLITLFLFIFLFFTLFLFYLQYLFYHTSKSKDFNKIPGPYKLPILGNFFDFFVDSVPLFVTARYLASNYKNINSVQICHIQVVNIYNPQDIEIVLSSSKYITKSNLYTFLHPWLKEGLLTSGGDKWRHRRKILTPTFHFNILKQFCKTFEEESQRLISHIKSQEQEIFDVKPIITQFAMNSICETAMGTQMNTNQSNFEKYKKATYEMGHQLVTRLIRFWLHIDIIFKITSVYRKQKKTIAILHNFTTSVIRERREQKKRDGNVSVTNTEGGFDDDVIKSSKKRLAMLDLLLSAEEEGKIDETGIREEVDTFMFEGHDTTAMAISFALMIIANNRPEQDKIVEELNSLFADTNQVATMDDLNNMKYLEMCIKESLRIYPSVPFISRKLEEDVQLTNYRVPSGTTCHVHIFDLHRDPSIYRAPEDFIPERFNIENSSKRHPFAYVPFSAGPRNCIGQRYALYEMKSVLSNILRNFILEPVTQPKDIVFSADLVLRSRDPIYVKFVPRQ